MTKVKRQHYRLTGGGRRVQSCENVQSERSVRPRGHGAVDPDRLLQRLHLSLEFMRVFSTKGAATLFFHDLFGTAVSLICHFIFLLGSGDPAYNALCAIHLFSIMLGSLYVKRKKKPALVNVSNGAEVLAVLTSARLPSITVLQTNHCIQLDLFEHDSQQAFSTPLPSSLPFTLKA